eukprot:gene15959-21656_t
MSGTSLTLYGSIQTRSPLINWYLYENNIPFIQKPPRPSNHPFKQIPFLTDNNGEVEVFESGAILLYLADKYDQINHNTPEKRSKYSKWVVWANSELDGICFGKGMSGSQLDKPSRSLDVLESILIKNEYIVDNKFSVADVAIASYLNYVPIFFNNINPVNRPNILKYMQRNAQRPAFSKAFGEDHTEIIVTKTNKWLK